MKSTKFSLLIVLAVCGTVSTFAQRTVELATVDHRRPVAELLDAIERLYGRPVHYEDPRYAYIDDIEDVTERVNRDPSRDPLKRILVPKARPITIYADVEADGTLLDASAAVREVGRLVDAASAAGAGRFDVHEHGENGLFVVPGENRKLDGTWAAADSILFTPINIQFKGNGAAALQAILAAITKAADIDIKIGPAPFGALVNSTVELGANDQPAGLVLASLLDQVGGGLSIRLLYAPDFRYYVFNTRLVPSHPSAANAGTPDANQQQGPSPWVRRQQ